MFQFEGKSAIVTGAGSGIGRAIALQLAAGGADVAIFDRDQGAAAKVAVEVAALGRRGLSSACDVAQPDSVDAAVQAVVEAWGGVQLLVNNAGISLMRSFLETSRAELQAQLDINFGGTWNMCQAVLPVMMEGGGGAVVNMSSWSGKTGRPLNAAYGAAKFALVGLTQSLAHEMGPHGIRVNAICPGLIVGTSMRSQTEREMRELGMPSTEERIKSIPMRRVGTPEDIANMTAFLLSEASSYVTGEAFNVTGGLWMN